jgi:serine protease Do
MTSLRTTCIAVLALGFCSGVVLAQTSTLEEQAFQQAAALAEPSIVRIETVGGLDVVGNLLAGTGPTTGVVISEDGYIITSSFNFISKPASVLVTLGDGRRFPAEMIASDRSKKLTLLKIDYTGLTPSAVAPSSEVRVGQWAIALGRTYDATFPSISVGIISALDRIWGRAVQTDAKVSPVNYGGPLVDIAGRAIGILVPLSPQGDGETAGVEWYDGGIGFAIPMEDIHAVLERLKAGEELKPGLMGVTFKEMGALAGEPVIDRVRPRSPADDAGLRVGDVILQADGKPIRRIPDLQHLLGPRYAGEEIALTVRRGDESLEVRVKLVDQLVPYEFSFLGILPTRPAVDAAAEGVEVREVLGESPAAAAGLQRGDLIVGFRGSPVTTAAELRDQVSRVLPNETADVTYRRGGQEATVTITLGTLPEAIPESLATSNVPAPDADGELPRTGRFSETLAGEEGAAYWAYVPEQYNPQYGYTLLVWLHPAADTMEAAMMRLWQTECDRRGIILVAPKAADISGWTPGEAEAVRAVVEAMQAAYTIDPARIVAHGHAGGGQFAWFTAFKHRDLFRGIMVSSSPLRQPPPDNDPTQRQQVLLLRGEVDALRAAIDQTAAGLRKLKFPVTLTPVPEIGEQYPDAAIESMIQWIDALDRI